MYWYDQDYFILGHYLIDIVWLLSTPAPAMDARDAIPKKGRVLLIEILTYRKYKSTF